MRPIETVILAAAVSLPAAAAPGLATRDLNPVLQAYYLPSYLPLRDDDGWQINHGFYITNTAQQDIDSDEALDIDVENYRYELALGWRRQNWIVHASMPLIANRGGRFDGLIEDWHDFWGFPNGDRDKFPEDEINIRYTRDGEQVLSETGSTSGVGDLAIAFGYLATDRVGYFVGIELPTGAESDLGGNEAVDVALWLSGQRPLGENATLYGMFGVSLPGDDGPLDDFIEDAIWLAQAGFDYRWRNGVVGTAQLDYHSRSVEGSDLDAFDHSLQLQLGLGFTRLFENYRLDLFFSEDILVGSAPDISMGLRVGRNF